MSFAAWTQWKELCAYARCSEGSREALGRLLQASFGKALHKLFCATGIPPELDWLLKDTSESRDYIWNIFEEHFTGASGSRRHLSRKDVMFEDILSDSEMQDAADATTAEELASRKLTAYARNSMRDVVLKYAQSAYSYQQRGRESSWEETTQDGQIERTPDGAEEADRLLPPMLMETDEEWFKTTSEAVAASVYEASSVRQRIAYAAKATGISLADEEVKNAAGCGHAQIYVAFNEIIETLKLEVARQTDGEDAQVVGEVRRHSAFELAELVRNDYYFGKLGAP